jgi:hypothetical protein
MHAANGIFICLVALNVDIKSFLASIMILLVSIQENNFKLRSAPMNTHACRRRESRVHLIAVDAM